MIAIAALSKYSESKKKMNYLPVIFTKLFVVYELHIS